MWLSIMSQSEKLGEGKGHDYGRYSKSYNKSGPESIHFSKMN